MKNARTAAADAHHVDGEGGDPLGVGQAHPHHRVEERDEQGDRRPPEAVQGALVLGEADAQHGGGDDGAEHQLDQRDVVEGTARAVLFRGDEHGEVLERDREEGDEDGLVRAGEGEEGVGGAQPQADGDHDPQGMGSTGGSMKVA
jgi:hypothetical protein